MINLAKYESPTEAAETI